MKTRQWRITMNDHLTLVDGTYVPVRAAASTCHIAYRTLCRWAAIGWVRAVRPHQRRVYVNLADVRAAATFGKRALHGWQMTLF